MVYADFEYYNQELHRTAISEEEFPFLAQKASAYIDTMTMGRAARASGDVLSAVKNAMCELAEVFRDEGRIHAAAISEGGEVASETVGSWSRTYVKRSAEDSAALIEGRKKDVLLLWLGNTGLFRAEGFYARGRRP